MNALLRPVAGDEDLRAIGALHFRSRCDAYGAFLPAGALEYGGPELMSEYWVERFRWERDDYRCTVAVADDGSIAGFTYLGPSEDPGIGLLDAIHVDPTAVGSGIGKLLMVDALGALPAYGRSAVLWVLIPNVRARQFYERGGWSCDDVTRIELIGGEPGTLVRYSRPVG